MFGTLQITTAQARIAQLKHYPLSVFGNHQKLRHRNDQEHNHANDHLASDNKFAKYRHALARISIEQNQTCGGDRQRKSATTSRSEAGFWSTPSTFTITASARFFETDLRVTTQGIVAGNSGLPNGVTREGHSELLIRVSARCSSRYPSYSSNKPIQCVSEFKTLIQNLKTLDGARCQ